VECASWLPGCPVVVWLYEFCCSPPLVPKEWEISIYYIIRPLTPKSKCKRQVQSNNRSDMLLCSGLSAYIYCILKVYCCRSPRKWKWQIFVYKHYEGGKTALCRNSGRGLGLPSHLSAVLEPKLPPNRKGLILINLSPTATIQLCDSTVYWQFVKFKVAYVSTLNKSFWVWYLDSDLHVLLLLGHHPLVVHSLVVWSTVLFLCRVGLRNVKEEQMKNTDDVNLIGGEIWGSKLTTNKQYQI